MNHFEAYSRRAGTIARHHPAPLIGPVKTRREAMQIYTELVTGLAGHASLAGLQAYLGNNESRFVQFHAELDFLWSGDGADFRGLEREIEDAFEAVEAAQYFNKFREQSSESQCLSL